MQIDKLLSHYGGAKNFDDCLQVSKDVLLKDIAAGLRISTSGDYRTPDPAALARLYDYSLLVLASCCHAKYSIDHGIIDYWQRSMVIFGILCAAEPALRQPVRAEWATP